MTAGPRRRAGGRDLAWLIGSVALPLPWLLVAARDGMGLPPEVTAPLSGLAILGAAFLLSWAVEMAEQDIPQSLALLALALVSVLPEYAVDLHFAIRAATEPEHARYAVANMTGANRLLIGFGWASVVLLACRRGRTTLLNIPHHQRLEIRFLLLATLFSFVIPLTGALNLLDAGVLLLLFAWYAWSASRGRSEATELVGPAAWIAARTSDNARRLVVVALFLYAAAAIYLAAEPFAEGLVALGKELPVDEFLLVQWVAPLASESPEFTIALLFAWRGRGALGIGALISSKVNQWTLLVGALPIAYGLAGGTLHGLPLDSRQSEELLLTSAQSLLAALLICNFGFSRFEAIVLAVLFAVQLVFPDSQVRIAFSLIYLAIFLGLMIHSPARRAAFLSVLRDPA